jgi:hypothetical protein
MGAEGLGFWARLWLAVVVWWRVLWNRALAADVRALLQGDASRPVPEARAVSDRPPLEIVAPAAADPTAALQLLALLQREGRLLDFFEEDVVGYSDAQVGAAARVIHEGCKRALREYLVLKPVWPENEGSTVVLEPGFDASRTRVTGRVVGEPPFRGRLAHHGWQVAEIRLPTVTAGHDPQVVAPAEVEL